MARKNNFYVENQNGRNLTTKTQEEKTMENMMEFIEILRNNPDKAFDYIANNGWKFDKSELVNITKELLYGIYAEAEHGLIVQADHDRILERAADELEEQYTEE